MIFCVYFRAATIFYLIIFLFNLKKLWENNQVTSSEVLLYLVKFRHKDNMEKTCELYLQNVHIWTPFQEWVVPVGPVIKKHFACVFQFSFIDYQNHYYMYYLFCFLLGRCTTPWRTTTWRWCASCWPAAPTPPSPPTLDEDQSTWPTALPWKPSWRVRSRSFWRFSAFKEQNFG